MRWEKYASIVRREWADLLGQPNASEQDFHKFLERHPCLIPGHDAFMSAGGWDNPAGPVAGCGFVVSKPLIPGISNRFPDFMWAPADSQTQWIVLVEIEDPKKPWFVKSGQRSAQLTQAEDQIAQWRSMLNDPANFWQFKSLYNIPGSRPIDFAYCLIYGRRRDVSNPSAAAKRDALRQGYGDITWMSYDHLRPIEDASLYPCARVSTNREFRAISFSPTIRLDPWLVKAWQRLKEKREAILGSPHFENSRREFLADRLEYWDVAMASGTMVSALDWAGKE